MTNVPVRSRNVTPLVVALVVLLAGAVAFAVHRGDLTSGRGTGAAPSVPPVNTVEFRDDFDGPAGALPSSSVWTYDLGGGGWGNDELQTYTDDPANVSLDGAGHLVISAQRSVSASGAVSYTSARLTTRGLASFTYGTLEARIKLPPAAPGLLPAFWLLGSDLEQVGYPASGEIDVVEQPGTRTDSSQTVHGPTTDGSRWQVGDSTAHDVPLSDDFHVFTLVRTPDLLTVKIDSATVYTLSRADLGDGQRWVFDKPFDVLLDIAVGGVWPGAPTDANAFPAQMLVDWIQVSGS